MNQSKRYLQIFRLNHGLNFCFRRGFKFLIIIRGWTHPSPFASKTKKKHKKENVHTIGIRKNNNNNHKNNKVSAWGQPTPTHTHTRRSRPQHKVTTAFILLRFPFLQTFWQARNFFVVLLVAENRGCAWIRKLYLGQIWMSIFSHLRNSWRGFWHVVVAVCWSDCFTQNHLSLFCHFITEQTALFGRGRARPKTCLLCASVCELGPQKDLPKEWYAGGCRVAFKF